MKASTKRRGRPRKIASNPRNDSPLKKESNIDVSGNKWTAIGSPYGLKIVLKKIDVRNSAIVGHPYEVSPTSFENFTFLSPQLTLPRIDSTLTRIDSITEQNISLFTIADCVDGQSLQQVYASYSESQSVICSPYRQPVITRSIYSMNAFNSCVRRRSRNILKDVKNTSDNRKIRKNIAMQPNLDGQENVPVLSSSDTALALPQVSVRLTQLNDQNVYQQNLVEKKFIESSSTVNFMQNSIESHLQSLSVGGINTGELVSGSPELIMKSVAQMNGISGPVHLEDAELVSLKVAPPAKRGRKRKSRKIKTTNRNSRKEPNGKMACRKKSRSSLIVSRQKTAANHIEQLPGTCSQETQCETIPSPEILQNIVEQQANDGECTQIIREETALQFCTSFEDQANVSPNFPKSPSGTEKTGFRVDISAMELCYSVKKKTIEKSEQQSVNYISKRKSREDDSSNESSEYNAPKKQACDKVGPSSNGMTQCFVSIKRIQKIQRSPNAISPLQPSNSFGSRTHLPTPHITRNQTTKNKESAEFFRIPWKKVKGIEKLNEKPAKSGVQKNSYPAKTLNEKPAKSDDKENGYPAKPEVKRRNVRTKKKSSKTHPVSPYLSYRTRQKTAQNGESTEFYRLPWKKTKGFEVVLNKSKKVDIKSGSSNEEPNFKGWPKENVSVAFSTVPTEDAETSISKKGILKHNDMLASSTPFPESSKRNANVSFASDTDRVEVEALSPVKRRRKTNETNDVFNGFPMRSCTVLLTCLPNPASKTPDRNKKRMTRREARRKAESVNQSRKAFETDAVRLKKLNKQTTSPYVRLRRLDAADITSYKITPLKEDRIPKKSKTDDDYGIDDINTDDSTDDEEFPKKCIPQWVKDLKNQPKCQSYLNPDTIHDWMKPPQFQYSLRHVFFSMKSHTFM